MPEIEAGRFILQYLRPDHNRLTVALLLQPMNNRNVVIKVGMGIEPALEQIVGIADDHRPFFVVVLVGIPGGHKGIQQFPDLYPQGRAADPGE